MSDCDQSTGNATPPLPSFSLSGLERELLGFGPESAYQYSDSFSDSNSDDGWSSDNPPWESAAPFGSPPEDDAAVDLDTSFDFLEDANLSMLPQPERETDPAHTGACHAGPPPHYRHCHGARWPVKQEAIDAGGRPAMPQDEAPVPADGEVAGQADTPRCPHCGRREDGERDALGDSGAPGRYKPRKRPRKENPLAFWNNKYGYVGQAYCKACSESFRSHLLRQGHQTRSGCSREGPCEQCAKILAGFDRPKGAVFQQYDDDRNARMQKRQAAQATASAGLASALPSVPVAVAAPAAVGEASPHTERLGETQRDPERHRETQRDTERPRKRTAVMAGAFAIMSTLSVVLINQGARGVLAHNGGGGGGATADDAALLGNRSAAAWANISSTPANITSDDGVSGDHIESVDSPLWTDPFTSIPAVVHHKLAVSVIISVLLACCGHRAKRRLEAKSRPPEKTEETKAGSPQAEVQFRCCGSRGTTGMTWARWLVAFSVVGCVYSLCLSLVIVFTWDITLDAPQQHTTEAMFTTAETLTLFAALPMFLIRFENLPHRKRFWHAWSFFAFIWVFSTVLRSLSVHSLAVVCVEQEATVNAADSTLAGQGSSCDLIIAAGLADCDSALAPVGELAHSCDVACGFTECSESEADTRTKREKRRAELLAVLGWIQLAHPLLHVALGVAIWQAVVQVKAEENRSADRSTEAATTRGQKTQPGRGTVGSSCDEVARQSLTLGLLDKAVTPWLSLRQSNEKLAQPPEHLFVDPEHLSIDDALSGAVRRPLQTDSMGLADSVYTASPLDLSVALGME